MSELKLRERPRSKSLKSLNRPSNREILKRNSAKKTTYILVKSIIEYIIALGAFIVLLPFLAAVALIIKLDSQGPIFFKQKRYGLKGEPFYIYKFRTMVDGAHKLQKRYSNLNEMNGGNLFKIDNDPRITRIGGFLRKYSIDELPQLINILKGEMTVIGPRPLSTPIEEYSPSQLYKFSVKPGLGSIWQAYYRERTNFDAWMKMDRIYAENISLGLDLKLLLNISKNVFKGNGAR